jgi:hypothetical protein
MRKTVEIVLCDVCEQEIPKDAEYFHVAKMKPGPKALSAVGKVCEVCVPCMSDSLQFDVQKKLGFSK